MLNARAYLMKIQSFFSFFNEILYKKVVYTVFDLFFHVESSSSYLYHLYSSEIPYIFILF